MRIAKIIHESIVDGPGIRTVVFVQGCPHKCKGCHNPDTWPMDKGTLYTSQELLGVILDGLSPLHQGVTFSGGEPILYAQELAEVAWTLRQHGWDIVLYTGYTLDKLLMMPVASLLRNVDWLIDGPFIEEYKDPSLQWRGSSNQVIWRRNTVLGSWSRWDDVSNI